jgi:hypothetical protein
VYVIYYFAIITSIIMPCDDLGETNHHCLRVGCHKLEVGAATNGHKLDVTWRLQDDVVGSREVDHIEGEHLGTVVARISESGRQINLPEGDELHAQDHSVKGVQARLFLSRSWPSPNPSKVLWYVRLRPLPPSMKALVNRVVSTSRSTMRRIFSALGYNPDDLSDQKL